MIRVILLSALALYALAGAALAADLPSRKGAPLAAYAPPPAYFTWSGLYAGLDIGYAWQKANSVNSAIAAPPIARSSAPKGAIGGGFLGYNYQFDNIVVGVEGGVEASGVSGYDAFGARLSQGVRGSVRGRLGYAFDRALFYATGGVEIADVNYRNPGYFLLPLAGNYSTAKAGWTVGGGLEFAFTRNWTGRVEYRYTDLGSASFASNTAFGQGYNARLKDNAVRAGVAYKFDFGGAPAAGRY